MCRVTKTVFFDPYWDCILICTIFE